MELPLDQNQMKELMKLAGTEPGRKLLSLLVRSSGPELRQALNRKDYDRAKVILGEFIKDPQVRELLKQLEN